METLDDLTQKLQEEMRSSAQVFDLTEEDQLIDLEESAENMEEADMTEDGNGEKRKTVTKPAFQGSTSPMRVANQHLKAKTAPKEK